MMCDPTRDPALPAVAGAEEPSDKVARSGAGADTAMLAMLKKRKMRARRDPEPQPPPAGLPGDESPAR